MKATTSKKTYVLAIAITILTNASVSLADQYASYLGAGNVNFASTDVYSLTCPIGTASVRARANNPDGSNVDEITVEIINPIGRARSAISHEGIPAPWAVFSGGAGHYLVTVHKDSTPVAMRYSITLDCYNSVPAAFLGTQSTMTQNQ